MMLILTIFWSAYAIGWLLYARSRYQAWRPTTVPICGQKNHNGAGTWHYSYAGQRYFERATGLDAAGHFPPSHENSCYHGPNERLLSDNEAFVWALCAAGPLWLPLIMVTGAGKLVSAAVRGKAPKRPAEVRAELAAAERELERVTAEVKKLK